MNSVPEIPGTRDLLYDFAERHHLQMTDLLEQQLVAVRARLPRPIS